MSTQLILLFGVTPNSLSETFCAGFLLILTWGKSSAFELPLILWSSSSLMSSSSFLMSWFDNFVSILGDLDLMALCSLKVIHGLVFTWQHVLSKSDNFNFLILSDSISKCCCCLRWNFCLRTDVGSISKLHVPDIWNEKLIVIFLDQYKVQYCLEFEELTFFASLVYCVTFDTILHFKFWWGKKTNETKSERTIPDEIF